MRYAARAVALAAIFSCACSAASPEPSTQTQAPDTADAGPEAASPVAPSPAPAVADSGAEAAPPASVCVELGASCVDSTTCDCGPGAGCAWDNVQCVSGRCAVVYPAADDAGAPEWQCCGGCQAGYDACMATGGAGCMAAWTQCNAGCGLPSACPVRCLAQ